MNVPDDELARGLLLRDGPAAERVHRGGSHCPYENLYPEGDCPWCAAQDNRGQSQTGGR